MSMINLSYREKSEGEEELLSISHQHHKQSRNAIMNERNLLEESSSRGTSKQILWSCVT